MSGLGEGASEPPEKDEESTRLWTDSILFNININ